MAGKLLTWKVPSISTLSNGLTYVALTGGLLMPALTAAPLLPQSIEAKAANIETQVDLVRAHAVPVARPSPAAAASELAAAETPTDLAAMARTPRTDVSPTPPPPLIVEARARLKTVKAKDAPSSAATDDDEQKPVASNRKRRGAKVDADAKANASDGETNGKSPPGSNADAKITDKAGKPPPTAVVPVQSAVPVNPTAPETSWSDAEVMSALKECLRLLAPVEVEVEANTAMRKGDCGTPAPILLKSIGTNPKIVLQPAAEVNCPMALALSQWSKETLQPAARDAFSSDVTRIVSSSGYSCRNRYGMAGERLSEHALANAIDIGGFALANGKVVKVSTGWGETERDRIAAAKAAQQAKNEEKAGAKTDDAKGKTGKSDEIPSPGIKGKEQVTRASLKKATAEDRKQSSEKSRNKTVATADTVATDSGPATSAEARFLRRLHKEACDSFGTVLGPEANEAHRDHFHFDLKARKRRSVCH